MLYSCVGCRRCKENGFRTIYDENNQDTSERVYSGTRSAANLCSPSEPRSPCSEHVHLLRSTQHPRVPPARGLSQRRTDVQIRRALFAQASLAKGTGAQASLHKRPCASAVCALGCVADCGPHSGTCNLGGHDYMSNLIRFLKNEVETGHCGFPLVDRMQMISDLRDLKVPPGSLTFAMMWGHTPSITGVGFTASFSTSGWSDVPSGYTQFSGSENYDIAMCARQQPTHRSSPALSSHAQL